MSSTPPGVRPTPATSWWPPENLHTLILKDGNVYSFGDNSLGRLGLSKSYGKTEGRILFDGGNEDKIAFITCGPDHSVAVSQNGHFLYAWGSCDEKGVGHPVRTRAAVMEQAGSSRDPYGNGTSDIDLHLPAEFLKLPTKFVCWEWKQQEPHRIIQVSCGAQHTIALREDGVVYTWSVQRRL